MPHGPRYARVNHGPLSWLRSNEQFTSDDSDALPILGSLASLYRRLLTGKELIEGGASQQEVTRATGQWSQAFLNRLRRASRTEIVHGLRRIAEVDNAIKNSEGTPRLQMEYLVAELTSAFSVSLDVRW